MSKKTIRNAMSAEKRKYEISVRHYADINTFGKQTSQNKTNKNEMDEQPTDPLSNNEPPTKKQISNEDITGLLRTIIAKQDNLLERINTLENIVIENTITKNELHAQNKIIREGLIISKQVLRASKRLLYEDFDEIGVEIAVRFPLGTIADVMDVEERLKDTKFFNSMKIYINKLKSGDGSIDNIFRNLVTDNVVCEFNWDGRCNKRALAKLVLFNEILSDAFLTKGVKEFQKEIRRSVELSHNRYKQKMFLQNKNIPKNVCTERDIKEAINAWQQ